MLSGIIEDSSKSDYHSYWSTSILWQLLLLLFIYFESAGIIEDSSVSYYHSYWTSDACSNNNYMWFIKIKSLKLQEGFDQSWSNAHHECLLFIQQEIAQARAKTSEKPTFWKLNTLEFIYCSSFSTHLIESTRTSVLTQNSTCISSHYAQIDISNCILLYVGNRYKHKHSRHLYKQFNILLIII